VAKSTSVVVAVIVIFFVVLFGIDYILGGLLSLTVSGIWPTQFGV
jgi:preprotein translocase subunit SecE